MTQILRIIYNIIKKKLIVILKEFNSKIIHFYIISGQLYIVAFIYDTSRLIFVRINEHMYLQNIHMFIVHIRIQCVILYK